MIIRSMLEQDVYKFNMCAHILRHHPNVSVRYRLFDRGSLFNSELSPEFMLTFEQGLEAMAELRITSEELAFLQETCPYLPPHFFDFLSNFRYDPRQVKYTNTKQGFSWCCEGPWETATLWECPIMALLSEVYYSTEERGWETPHWKQDYQERTEEKVLQLLGCHVAEFGFRRRHSYEVQDLVVTVLKNQLPNFVGVSNVHMAHKHGLKAIGTMAHEMFMAYSVLEGLRHANRFVLRDWSETFQGEVGIALTDTFGTPAFFRDFQSFFARLFDGVRHDSGSPFLFAAKVIKHYETLRIDPLSKSIVFSDSLDTRTASLLQQEFSQKIKVSFGIGSHLTHDFPSHPSPNFVVKMTHCKGTPVVKLSDDSGKSIGEEKALEVARWIHT